MPAAPLKVLLIEDDADHAALIQRHFGRAADQPLKIQWVERLADAEPLLSRGEFDAVLTDLRLPDSDTPDTLSRITALAPDVPIVVLTSLDALDLATQAVQQGAQDYLVKAQISGDLLHRSIRYAIERKRHAVELERSNRELERFAHLVAHEVKTPLSIVQYCCDLLERYKERLEGEAWEFVVATRNAVQGLGDTISELLEYASVGAHNSTLMPVDSGVVHDEAVSNLQLAINETQGRITRDALPTVTADLAQLRLVFQNLIGNALKYHRPGVPPEVHVSAKRERGDWQFRVRDNGIGIDPHHYERIFGIFERLHTAEEYPGTGIGLAICKRIIEQHGGRIWVESTPGQGSTFYFTLPTVPSY